MTHRAVRLLTNFGWAGRGRFANTRAMLRTVWPAFLRSFLGVIALALASCSAAGPPAVDAGTIGMDAGSTGDCTGTATRCELRNAASCEAGGGCEISYCVGTDPMCATLDETACALRAACAWDPTTTPAETPCIGTPPSCASLSVAACESVPGCGRGGGTDAGTSPDAGPRADTGGVVPPGCNEAGGGVECDGDWAGRCTPACAAGECCSPQAGRFTCVATNADGTCPAADIFLDTTRIDGDYAVEWRYFAPDDCSLIEGCVDAPGWRRLLRFDTWTPNIGGADLHLGATPADGMVTELYDWSACHGHHHFNTYAAYELLASDGSVAAEGHKQAFCLLDFYRYPGTDGRGGFYNCNFQGIQRDWQDVYDRDLDCQWVDVTDVAPGTYSLHVELNGEHLLNEEDYSNNDAMVSVVIPPPATDITAACTWSGDRGLGRDCGWSVLETRACTPGAMVSLACSAACGSGSCTGDTLLRVCETSAGLACAGAATLGTNDDSGCAARDLCSRVNVTCPPSGSVQIFTAPFAPGDAVTCALGT